MNSNSAAAENVQRAYEEGMSNVQAAEDAGKAALGKVVASVGGPENHYHPGALGNDLTEGRF